jgi:hypothetical protein
MFGVLKPMKMRILFAAALLAALSTPLLSAAQISGKVTLKGTPPAERKIEFDPTCGKLHDADVTTRHYVVSKEGGLANVFVYLKAGLPAKSYTPPSEVKMLDQKDCMYEPYVLGVMTDQKFKIKNSDPLMHNVHAMPKVAGNDEFNIGQPLKDMVTEKSFPKREVLVKFKCDVHNWMFAYVGVMDHPYFAVTDKEGNFKLPADLPAGTYTIEAFHLKAGTVTQEVTVTADDKKTVDLSLEVKKQ